MAAVDGHTCVQLETDRWVGVGILGSGGPPAVGAFQGEMAKGAGPLEVSVIGVRGPALWEAGTSNPSPLCLAQRAEEQGAWSRTIHKDTSA